MEFPLITRSKSKRDSISCYTLWSYEAPYCEATKPDILKHERSDWCHCIVYVYAHLLFVHTVVDKGGVKGILLTAIENKNVF